MAPPTKAIVVLAAGAGLAALRWWKSRRQQRQGCQSEASPPGTPATAAPLSPPGVAAGGSAVHLAHVPSKGVMSPASSAPASPSSPSAASSSSPPAPAPFVASPSSGAWLIAKAKKLVQDIGELDPFAEEHPDELAQFVERGRQIMDLLSQHHAQLAPSTWEELREIRFVPVERAADIDVPMVPVTYGFEAPGQVVLGQHRNLRFAGQFVMREECGHCLRSQDDQGWDVPCPACQPPPQVCGALRMPKVWELADSAGRLLCTLLRNPSWANIEDCIAVEGLAPAADILAEAPEPESVSVVRRDLDSLLHPRGPLELPSFMVARLRHRVDSEAIVVKHSGAFARRLEQAAMLPRTATTPRQSEEEWRAAQEKEAAADLARLRRHFGEAFDE